LRPGAHLGPSDLRGVSSLRGLFDGVVQLALARSKRSDAILDRPGPVASLLRVGRGVRHPATSPFGREDRGLRNGEGPATSTFEVGTERLEPFECGRGVCDAGLGLLEPQLRGELTLFRAASLHHQCRRVARCFGRDDARL
jgi:hypothetical protein